MAGCCGRDEKSGWSRHLGVILWLLMGLALLGVWVGRQTGLITEGSDTPAGQVGR